MYNSSTKIIGFNGGPLNSSEWNALLLEEIREAVKKKKIINIISTFKMINKLLFDFRETNHFD